MTFHKVVPEQRQILKLPTPVDNKVFPNGTGNYIIIFPAELYNNYTLFCGKQFFSGYAWASKLCFNLKDQAYDNKMNKDKTRLQPTHSEDFPGVCGNRGTCPFIFRIQGNIGKYNKRTRVLK